MSQNNIVKSFGIGLGIGLAIGAILALIYAPQPGAVTREQIKGKWGEAVGKVKETTSRVRRREEGDVEE
jgi:gas vesicle protein